MFVIIVNFYIHLYFTETRLRYDGIYNNQIIANCPQSMIVKKVWKSVNNWQRYGQK